MLPVAVAKIPPPSPAPAPHLLPGDDSNDVSSLLQATTAAVEAADAVTGSELDWLYVDVDRWAGVTSNTAASDAPWYLETPPPSPPPSPSPDDFLLRIDDGNADAEDCTVCGPVVYPLHQANTAGIKPQ